MCLQQFCIPSRFALSYLIDLLLFYVKDFITDDLKGAEYRSLL